MRRVIMVLAALALVLVLGGCGGDDETAAKGDPAGDGETTTQPARTTRTVAPEPPQPKVPPDTARDVKAVRAALTAAGYKVKQSKSPGEPLARLDVGATLVAFYANADEAAKTAAAIKKVLGEPGRDGVRSRGKRLYFASLPGKLTDAERDRFAKIVSTSEGAL